MELPDLSADGDRESFFGRHPSLLAPVTVQRLCARSLELLRVDLDRAGAAARTAIWVARKVGSELDRGKAARALANVKVLQRDSQGALECSEAALEHFEQAGDQQQAAITQTSAVQSLINLGQYERALEWIENARAVFRAADDDLHLARLELNAGALWARRDRPEEALTSFRAALVICRRLGKPEDIGVCLRNIAVCLQDLNDLDAAESAYVEAREYLEANDLPLLASEVDYNVAYLYYLRGEYVRAIKLFESGRRRSEELGDRHHQALSDLDLSEVFLELNLIEEAASLADKACEGFLALEMNYERAKALTNRAIAASRLGKTQDSIELLEQARAVFESEGNMVWLAMLDLYRAVAVLSEGRFYEAAQFGADALERFGELALPGKMAMCEILLARVDLEGGAPGEALKRCAGALERLEPLNLPALEHQALVVRGRAYELLGDDAAALATYREARERLERPNYHWQTDEFRMAFLEDKLEVYESLVALELDGEPTADRWKTAFGHIERSKSRSLADLVSFRAHAIPARSEQPEMVAHLRRLREELKGYYGRIRSDERDGKKSATRIAGLRRQVEHREEKLAKTLSMLRTVDREFSSLQAAATVPLEDIQASLSEDAALLEFFFARGVVYGCVVRRDGLELAPIAAQGHVRELHRSLQFQLSKFLLSPGYLDQFEDLVAKATHTYQRALFDELIAPLVDVLDCKHLTVVPHEFLHHLPFHALHDGEQHLMDRYSISYSPSASVHCLSATKPPAGGEGVLVMGQGGELAPWILDEAAAVAEALPGAVLQTGAGASLEALRRGGATSRIVHLATYGSFRADNPMFSTIQLGDGDLSLFDFFDLALDAELVVLTGCGAGLGAGSSADEHVSLVRGLLYAGARSVVTTLWDANDESRMIFMRDFYRHLGDTRRPAEALRRAAQDLREIYDHPYFWAPFVLSGRHEFV